jgi:NitT/TauT family transport system permease protein
MFVLSMVLVGVGWELYKGFGPQDGGTVLGWRVLPRAKDRVMPHVSDIVSRFGDPISRSSDESVLSVVLKAVGYSLRLVLAGFAVGLVAGVLLAIVMTRFRIAARAVLPYLSSSVGAAS